jgi:hypothetical protein
MYEAVAKLKSLGAELVNIPDSYGNVSLYGSGENEVVNFEFKEIMNSYLSELQNTKIKTIEGNLHDSSFPPPFLFHI